MSDLAQNTIQGLPHKYHLKARLSTLSVANILEEKETG